MGLAVLSLGMILACGVIYYVLLVIGGWKVNTKAGEAGWKSLIPIYNQYILFKIGWKKVVMFIPWAICTYGSAYCSYAVQNGAAGSLSTIGGLLGIVGLVLSIIQYNKLSKSFGHGAGFTAGLVLLNPIFIMILGLGSSQYQGPQD